MTTRWLQPQKHKPCKSAFRFFTLQGKKKDDLQLSQEEMKRKMFNDFNKRIKDRN